MISSDVFIARVCNTDFSFIEVTKIKLVGAAQSKVFQQCNARHLTTLLSYPFELFAG